MLIKEICQPLREAFTGTASPVGSHLRKERKPKIEPKKKVEDLVRGLTPKK